MNKTQIVNLAIGIAAGMALFQVIIGFAQYAGLKKTIEKNST